MIPSTKAVKSPAHVVSVKPAHLSLCLPICHEQSRPPSPQDPGCLSLHLLCLFPCLTPIPQTTEKAQITLSFSCLSVKSKPFDESHKQPVVFHQYLFILFLAMEYPHESTDRELRSLIIGLSAGAEAAWPTPFPMPTSGFARKDLSLPGNSRTNCFMSRLALGSALTITFRLLFFPWGGIPSCVAR